MDHQVEEESVGTPLVGEPTALGAQVAACVDDMSRVLGDGGKDPSTMVVRPLAASPLLEISDGDCATIPGGVGRGVGSLLRVAVLSWLRLSGGSDAALALRCTGARVCSGRRLAEFPSLRSAVASIRAEHNDERRLLLASGACTSHRRRLCTEQR